MGPMFFCMAARGSHLGERAVLGDAQDPPKRWFNLCISDRNYSWQTLFDYYDTAFGGSNEPAPQLPTLENHVITIADDDLNSV